MASTLALVMLLIGESLPDHLREKYAPAPEPEDGPDERGGRSRPNRAIRLVKCGLPSKAFGEQNGLSSTSIGTVVITTCLEACTQAQPTSTSSGGPVSEQSEDPVTTGELVSPAAPEPSVKRKPIWRHLYFWVLVAIVAGVVVGLVAPDFAVKLQAFG